MQGRRIAAHRTLVMSIAALTAFIAVAGLCLALGRGEKTAPAWLAQREPTRVSQALAATEQRTPQDTTQRELAPSQAPEATPTLRETVQAAAALVHAGVMPQAAPTPTLKQVLESADALVKAGVIPAPTPTLEQVLIAADQIRIASLPPAPVPAAAPVEPAAPPQPTLQEILLAADAIRIANEAQQRAAAAPPPPPPPPPAPAAAPQQSGGSGFWDASFTGQVLALVNQRRAAAGLGPVAVEPRLEQSARDYAKVLADSNTFSHTGPDGSTLVSRVTATGFPFDVQIGEVLAWGTDHWRPAEIVQAWMDSPGHREQMLGPYTRAGAGCYFTDNGSTVRCVIDFAG